MFERFGRHARVAVILAQEEARELGDLEIRPEHLLVGVLQSTGRELSATLAGYGLTADRVRAKLSGPTAGEPHSLEEDAEALRVIGIDLHAVRERVNRMFGENVFDSALRDSGRRIPRRRHIPFTRSAKKALELALREALAHKDTVIDSEHLLLGILRGGDRAALQLITDEVDVAELRGGIVALLDRRAA
jgi:ATP-dependent Clp protease ATP-binding subunit ClpA